MEKIICNPGLQHLAEQIFWNLDVEDLKICAKINQYCKQILQNPIFALRKFENLSKKNRLDWTKVIQLVKNSDKGIAIIAYLKWNLNKKIVDLPCYSSPGVQDDFRKKLLECCKKTDSSDEDIEIFKILAPLTGNPNAQDESGETPINWAAVEGHTKIVKILAPLTDNPNAPDQAGWTPIHSAAFHGHAEIVKILAPLTENPNAQNNFGITPIHYASTGGYTEIVKTLIPFIANPNAPDKFGKTPILLAARWGHTEIVKTLTPLTDNPNAPDKYGVTPSSVAKNDEIREILESNASTPANIKLFDSVKKILNILKM